jgi:hypothetical protein
MFYCNILLQAIWPPWLFNYNLLFLFFIVGEKECRHVKHVWYYRQYGHHDCLIIFCYFYFYCRWEGMWICQACLLLQAIWPPWLFNYNLLFLFFIVDEKECRHVKHVWYYRQYDHHDCLIIFCYFYFYFRWGGM